MASTALAAPPDELALVRSEVGKVLSQSPAWQSLEAGDRKAFAQNMLKVASYLARDPGWLDAADPPGSTAMAETPSNPIARNTIPSRTVGTRPRHANSTAAGSATSTLRWSGSAMPTINAMSARQRVRMSSVTFSSRNFRTSSRARSK